MDNIGIIKALQDIHCVLQGIGIVLLVNTALKALKLILSKWS